VKKVLHNALTLRGRCSRVVLVCEDNESKKRKESKSDLTIPGTGGRCALRRSPRLQAQGVVATNAKPKSKTPTISKLRLTDEQGSTGLKPGSKELDVKANNEVLLEEHLPITIPQDSGRILEVVEQNIITVSPNLNFASPGIVVKSSWVSPVSGGVESDLLRECSGLFGTPNHYYSFLACHAIIRQLPTISFFLMMMKLGLVTGFLPLSPTYLIDVPFGCISHPLLVNHC